MKFLNLLWWKINRYCTVKFAGFKPAILNVYPILSIIEKREKDIRLTVII